MYYLCIHEVIVQYQKVMVHYLMGGLWIKCVCVCVCVEGQHPKNPRVMAWPFKSVRVPYIVGENIYHGYIYIYPKLPWS